MTNIEFYRDVVNCWSMDPDHFQVYACGSCMPIAGGTESRLELQAVQSHPRVAYRKRY